jgi:hypothetical protein
MNRESSGQTAETPGVRKDGAGSLRSIAGDLDLPDLMARILMARGIASPHAARIFLKPRLEDLQTLF